MKRRSWNICGMDAHISEFLVSICQKSRGLSFIFRVIKDEECLNAWVLCSCTCKFGTLVNFIWQNLCVSDWWWIGDHKGSYKSTESIDWSSLWFHPISSPSICLASDALFCFHFVRVGLFVDDCSFFKYRLSKESLFLNNLTSKPFVNCVANYAFVVWFTKLQYHLFTKE